MKSMKKSLLEDDEKIAELLGTSIQEMNSAHSANIQNNTETVVSKNTEDSVSDTGREKRSNEETAMKELFLQLDEMRSRVLPHSKEIVAEHREEVFHAIKTFLNVLKIAREDGLVPLEREIKILSESSIQSDQVFAFGVQAMLDDFWPELVMDKIFSRFQMDSDDIYKDFMLYFCIRIVIAMQEGLSCHIIKKIYLSMLPLEEHKAFEEYLKYGIYVVNGGS